MLINLLKIYQHKKIVILIFKQTKKLLFLLANSFVVSLPPSTLFYLSQFKDFSNKVILYTGPSCK